MKHDSVGVARGAGSVAPLHVMEGMGHVSVARALHRGVVHAEMSVTLGMYCSVKSEALA
jgi:hypothetical protein